MKYTIASSSLLFVAFVATPVSSETYPSISQALQNGDTSINTRTFYFNRSFDRPGTRDAEALTLGGIMKYESADFHRFKVGFAYYGSHSLLGIIDREKGGGTSLLKSDGEDIAFLGEAYIDYMSGTHQLTVGRQRLSGPIMNDHDLRLLPSSYEAAVYRNTGVENILLEAGYVARYSGFTSRLSDFDKQSASWGEDGLAYILASTKLGNIALRGQYIDALDDRGTYDNYSYLDANIPLSMGRKSYIKGQVAGTGYEQGGDDSLMYGLKAGTTFGSFDLAILYNVIEDNLYRAVEAGPMYSDWQQGYGNYEPSDAIGVQLVYNPSENTSFKLGYVDVESEDGDAFNIDSFSEANLDAKYQINDLSKVRLRYSIKDQDSSSDREDRDDFRIIYYYNF